MNVTYTILIFSFIFRRLQCIFVVEIKTKLHVSPYLLVCYVIRNSCHGPWFHNCMFLNGKVLHSVPHFVPSRLECVSWSSYLVIHLFCSCCTQVSVNLTLHQLV
jgi:hypothetical protein